MRSEFQVNTTTAGDQEAPTIATHSRGGFVLAWQSKNQVGDGKGIFAQRFDGPMTKRDIGAVASPSNNGGSADKLGPHALDALAQNVAKLGRELALKFEAVDAAPQNRGLARRIDYGVVDDGERP